MNAIRGFQPPPLNAPGTWLLCERGGIFCVGHSVETIIFSSYQAHCLSHQTRVLSSRLLVNSTVCPFSEFHLSFVYLLHGFQSQAIHLTSPLAESSTVISTPAFMCPADHRKRCGKSLELPRHHTCLFMGFRSSQHSWPHRFFVENPPTSSRTHVLSCIQSGNENHLGNSDCPTVVRRSALHR